MDLKLNNKYFLVCGATSGFGKSITTLLLNEGANVIGVARNIDLLNDIQKNYKNFIPFKSDVLDDSFIISIKSLLQNFNLHGAVINAGGPPAKSFAETNINDWDNSYKLLVRWKVELTKILIDKFVTNLSGKIVYIESVSVKQPVDNLILSNSMRLAIVGFVKTIAKEYAKSGITFNIIAPGYHHTQALDRIIKKNMELYNISFSEAKNILEKLVPMEKLGDPNDLATLAIWLLSEYSKYVTGQVFTIDGGLYKGTL